VRPGERARTPQAVQGAARARGSRRPAVERTATAPTTILRIIVSLLPPALCVPSLRQPSTNCHELAQCQTHLDMQGCVSRSARALAGSVRGARGGAWCTTAQRRAWDGAAAAFAPGAGAGGAVHARRFGLYDEMLAMAGRMDTAKAARRTVPDSIVAPDYALTGTPSATLPKAQWMIEQHSDEDIALARIAGRISREVLDEAGRAVAAGVTTDEIDRIVHEETIKRGAYPSPLNYHGFPRSVCTSINEVVCHGIPENRTLREGDIINIDVSCYIGGFHGDNSEMFCVGEVDDAAKELIQVHACCGTGPRWCSEPGAQLRMHTALRRPRSYSPAPSLPHRGSIAGHV
jgi:hypothetical protein